MNKTETIKSTATAEIVLAADLGGTHLRVAAVDSNGRVLNRVKQQTPRGDRAEEIVAALTDAATMLSGRLSDRSGNIRALSVVVPGTVQAETGVVAKAPNLPSLNSFPLSAALEAELPWPAVVENDANAAAVGEAWQGAARDYQTSICLTLGTGVGGGIILDGKLWRGIDGSGGEIGHISVEANGHPCQCGSCGCLESYASATAIVRLAAELRKQNFGAGSDHFEFSTAESVYQAALGGDKTAIEAFRVMGFYLGVGMASLVNIFNPEVIVVAGGVAAGWELFYPYAREQVDTRAFPVPARRVKILSAERGDDAGLLGAARIAFLSKVGQIVT